MKSVIPQVIALVASLVMSQGVLADPLEDASLEEALSAYVDGLRTGDVKTLGKLFSSDGQFCFNGKKEIECSSFAQALPTWVVKPDPATSGKVIAKEIIEDSMARVTYELAFNGTTYLDYFLMYKNSGRWVVVAKTTFYK